jgi:hypothetical protein
MKLRRIVTLLLAFGLCGPGGIAWPAAAEAQSLSATSAPSVASTATATSAAASISSATTVTTATAAAPAATSPSHAPWSAVNLPGTTVYQDNLIGGGSLAPDISKGDDDGSDAGGLARSLQVDGVVSALSSRDGGSSTHVTENGIIAKSQWETVAYGAWSLDASARAGGSDLGPSEQGQGGAITLRQRGMPFDGGWMTDNALGDINTPNIGLAQFQTRFYLPTAPMQGLATAWRGPDGLQLVAGGGVPGLFDGIEVPDFRTLDGSTATAGAQWSPASNWTVGGQLVEARDVNLAVGQVIALPDDAALISSTTGLVSAAWADHGEHLQLNLLDGEVSGKSNALGGWVDGSITQGRVQQSAGIFRIDPNLTWGNQVIADDMQGGYYRFDYQSRQWMFDAGIDEVHSVSGLGSNTTFLTGDTRYQMSRDWGIGSVANVSRTDGGTNWSLEGYVDHANTWGTGRAQADYAQTQAGEDAMLTLDQNWSGSTTMRLSTSTSVERISGTGINGLTQDATVLGLAAYGGGQFTSRLSLDGNVRWAAAVQGRAAPGVSANVSLTYQLSPNWQILATYYDSRIGSWTPLTVVSPLTPPVETPVAAVEEHGVFLTFRYRRAAGLHFAPLGGPPGGGSGEIAGIVYLDANDNGRPDAGEAGAPNITVVLDGRYSVQTDAAGRFVFPVVATGHHVIQAVADNLPLPWTLLNNGRAEFEVTTRDRTEVDMAAQRPR